MDAIPFFNDNGEIVAWSTDFFTLLLGGIFLLLLVKLSGSLRYIEQLFVASGAKNKGKGSVRWNEKVNEIREQYDLTERGFLPDFCLEKLPEYYKEWEEVALRLPELNKVGKLKEEVLKMKLLSCDYLTNDILLRRAYILLGMLVHSYVNGENAVWLKVMTDCDIIKEERKIEGDVREEEMQVENNGNVNGSINDISRGDDKREISIGEGRPSCVENDKDYNGGGGGDGDGGGGNGESSVGDVPSEIAWCNIPNVPSQLAIPWCTVCKRLDMPLILTAALDLWNWKLKDNAKRHQLSNLTSLSTMTGTSTEIYFHMVPCAMQYVAGPLIPQVLVLYHVIADAVANAEDYSTEYMCKNLLSFMADLANMYKEFKAILARIKDYVDVDTFYDIYRPLLNGFWPDGVFYNLVHDDVNDDDNDDVNDDDNDDVNDDGRKKVVTTKNRSMSLDFLTNGGTSFDSVIIKRFPHKGVIANPKGPSAGQSTMILLFDLLLGIKHRGSGEEFQDEMTNYMPPRHRQMIFDLRNLVQKYGTLRDFIIRSNNLPSHDNLVSTYNECIKAVSDFRSMHLGIAVKYLVRTKRGTGSSSFRDMLNEMVLSTKQAIINL